MSVRKAYIMLVLIAGLVVVSGCAGSKENALPHDKYVAIQEDLSISCTLIESNNYTPTPHITLPMEYDYKGSGIHSNNYYPEVNDSLKILYGTTSYRTREPWDTVTGLSIRGVYSLPYVCESGFVFESIDKNGTIFGNYNNTSIVLRKGEKWGSPVFSEIKSEKGMAQGQRPFSYTASYNTIWMITNMGVYDKANLTRSDNSKTAAGYNNSY
jgi:hypothetical protein